MDSGLVVIHMLCCIENHAVTEELCSSLGVNSFLASASAADFPSVVSSIDLTNAS